jgi:hypothetical protein
MEATIRGAIEEEIEYITRQDILEGNAKAFQKDFPMKSVEDLLFGFILGHLLTSYANLIRIAFRREVTHDEIEKLWELLKKRTMEIRGKIKLALSK